MRNLRRYFRLEAMPHTLVMLMSLFLVVSCSNEIRMNKNLTDASERVDDFLNSQIQDHQMPGVQYVVFNQDGILYEYNGGLADVQGKREITPESLMGIFSTTKLITAIAILQLAEQHKLSLDDTIQKHAPGVPYKDVTIRHVLSHSSGISDPVLGNFYIHWEDEHNAFNQDELLDTVMSDNSKLEFEPGKEILYSNLGYAILGKVIENVSGLKYEQYVEKNIFEKLGLSSKEINFGHQLQPDAARPYYKSTSILYNFMVLFIKDRNIKKEGKWKSLDKPYYFNFPAHGGIVASAGELSKIFIDLMGPSPKVLTGDSKNIMFTEQSSFKEHSIAVSWFKTNMNGEPYFSHQGGGVGYISEVRVYPEQLMGSVLLINRSDVDSLSLLNTLDSEFISKPD